MLIISVQTSALAKSCRYNNGSNCWYDRRCQICPYWFCNRSSRQCCNYCFDDDATNTFTAMICAELGSSTPEADGSFLVREGLQGQMLL